jgi:histone deacetylase complex regulatory component SIN3
MPPVTPGLNFSGLINAVQDITQQIGQLIKTLNTVLPAGAYQPFSESDAAAPTNSIYYSTTQNALVYKDFSSVVHVLS